MVTKPVPNTARWEGLIACLWFLLVDALLLNWALRRPVDAVKFVLCYVACHGEILLLTKLLPRLFHCFACGLVDSAAFVPCSHLQPETTVADYILNRLCRCVRSVAVVLTELLGT